VASAVRAYLEGKVATIATLKVMGAEGGLIFRIYLLQIGVLALFGVVAGLVLGAGVPLALAPLISASLPFPAAFALYPMPLVEAAFYGLLTALLFSVWPLAVAQRQRAVALYRGAMGRVLPGPWHLAAIVMLALLLIGGAVWFSGTTWLALGTTGGVAAALLVLALAAVALRWLARRVARMGWLRGRVGWRLALAALGGPRAETLPVILSLGLGLSVLATVGQIDHNLRASIQRDLPAKAPSFFFMDIQDDQLPGYLARLHADPAVTKVETAPMLRGVISRINGRPAREVVGDHWVVSGDRGLTFSAEKPAGTTLTEGAWWPKDYVGPAQVSFGAQEAAEMKLPLGTRLTLNILGRDIEATITSFRKVDFSNAGMGFVMSIDPAAVAGAPHTSISTVYVDTGAEAKILRDLSKTYPNITAIAVKEAIARASDALSAIATATAWAAGATLLTGFVVLIGAAAAGAKTRIYEAALLKVLGASRARILFSFALRAALMGAAAGLVALLAGSVSAALVMTYVMDSPYEFAPVSAAAIILGGVLATLLAGLAFAWAPLAARPAQVLRSQE
jgi:putative ABC transport system permease protein